MCNNLLHSLCCNLSEWWMTLRIFLHSFHIQSISDLTWPQVSWSHWMVWNTKHQVTETKAANHIHRIVESQWTDNVHCIPVPVVWMQIIQNELKINQLEDSTHLWQLVLGHYWHFSSDCYEEVILTWVTHLFNFLYRCTTWNKAAMWWRRSDCLFIKSQPRSTRRWTPPDKTASNPSLILSPGRSSICESKPFSFIS